MLLITEVFAHLNANNTLASIRKLSRNKLWLAKPDTSTICTVYSPALLYVRIILELLSYVRIIRIICHYKKE